MKSIKKISRPFGSAPRTELIIHGSKILELGTAQNQLVRSGPIRFLSRSGSRAYLQYYLDSVQLYLVELSQETLKGHCPDFIFMWYPLRSSNFQFVLYPGVSLMAGNPLMERTR